MIKVSVVMSVYNGEEYLREAIQSILDQSFRDFEFIIVDDCSTDSTSAILSGYSRSDPRIIVINNSRNSGLTRSLNRAIKTAAGEYIARMDCDDVALPQRIQKQFDSMELNPETVLLGTAFYEIDASGRELNRKTFPVADSDIRKTLIKFNPFCHASVMIRKTALDKAGLYNEQIPSAQDYELWMRLAQEGKVANLPEYLMKRRYSDENISIVREREQLKWALRIRKNAIQKGYFSALHYVYLARPFIAYIAPFFLRRSIRKYVLQNKMYG